jgi:aryl-alcohol dehydrogenase-like predicted oxidoreductase
VSELFLGAMRFGEGGGGASPDQSAAACSTCTPTPGNIVDTAINYRGGQSESILGELLEGHRDRFVVATKYTISRDGGDPNAAGNHRKNLTLRWRRACGGCAPTTSTCDRLATSDGLIVGVGGQTAAPLGRDGGC